MDKSIGVGLIIGVVVTTSTWIWNSDLFNKPQKYLLIAFALFPPIHIIGIIVVLLFNRFFKNLYSVNGGSNNIHSHNKSTKKNHSKLNKPQVPNNTSEKTTNINNNKIIKDQLELYKTTLSDLKNLKLENLITQDEFHSKSEVVESKIKSITIKQSKEFKQLENLLNQDLLTAEEFEEKVNLLSDAKNKNRVKPKTIKSSTVHRTTNSEENKNIVKPKSIKSSKVHRTINSEENNPAKLNLKVDEIPKEKNQFSGKYLAENLELTLDTNYRFKYSKKDKIFQGTWAHENRILLLIDDVLMIKIKLIPRKGFLLDNKVKLKKVNSTK